MPPLKKKKILKLEDYHQKDINRSLACLRKTDKFSDLKWICTSFKDDGTVESKTVSAHKELFKLISPLLSDLFDIADKKQPYEDVYISIEEEDFTVINKLTESLYLGQTTVNKRDQEKLNEVLKLLGIKIDLQVDESSESSSEEDKPDTKKTLKKPGPQQSTKKTLEKPESKSKSIKHIESNDENSLREEASKDKGKVKLERLEQSSDCDVKKYFKKGDDKPTPKSKPKIEPVSSKKPGPTSSKGNKDSNSIKSAPQKRRLTETDKKIIEDNASKKARQDGDSSTDDDQEEAKAARKREMPVSLTKKSKDKSPDDDSDTEIKSKTSKKEETKIQDKTNADEKPAISTPKLTSGPASKVKKPEDTNEKQPPGAILFKNPFHNLPSFSDDSDSEIKPKTSKKEEKKNTNKKSRITSESSDDLEKSKKAKNRSRKSSEADQSESPAKTAPEQPAAKSTPKSKDTFGDFLGKFDKVDPKSKPKVGPASSKKAGPASTKGYNTEEKVKEKDKATTGKASEKIFTDASDSIKCCDNCGKIFVSVESYTKHLATHDENEEKSNSTSDSDHKTEKNRIKKSSAKIKEERKKSKKSSSSDDDDDRNTTEKPKMGPKSSKPGPKSSKAGPKSSKSGPASKVKSGPASKVKKPSFNTSDSSDANKEDRSSKTPSSSSKVKISLLSSSSASKKLSTKSPAASKPKKESSLSGSSKNDGPLKCRFCDYGAESAQNLKNHVLNHFKEQIFPSLPSCIPFLCPECKKPSRDKITLLRHYAWSHNMILNYASKEDFTPRPKDHPIRNPKYAKPSSSTSSSTKPSPASSKKSIESVKSKAVLPDVSSSSNSSDSESDKKKVAEKTKISASPAGDLTEKTKDNDECIVTRSPMNDELSDDKETDPGSDNLEESTETSNKKGGDTNLFSSDEDAENDISKIKQQNEKTFDDLFNDDANKPEADEKKNGLSEPEKLNGESI